MWGLLPVLGEAEQVGEIYLWPENVKVWNLFVSLETQWNSGFSGATGLNYQAVEIVMRKWRIPRKDELDVFLKIQAMERATLKAWKEMQNG